MMKYQTERSPNASVENSYGEEISRLTGLTGRSWGNTRKIPKEIDFSDNTEFPPIKASGTTSNANQNQNNTSNINDESITDTATVIQQAIDNALKKAYEEHRKEITDMQDKFNRQLELIQQQQNTTTLEKKFDKLMEMLANGNTNITRESPIRKKGKPNNLETTTFSQIETPTRSNKQQNNSTSDSDMDTEEEEEEPMGPHFEQEINSTIGDNNNTNQDTINEPEPLENEWITKEKKEKKTAKMTQTKIVDLMSNGGYGNGKSSPARKPANQSPSRMGKHTPPRQGRGTPPRPTQSERINVVLTKLSSTRGGHKESHGREN
jgi:hypothetical protein